MKKLLYKDPFMQTPYELTLRKSSYANNDNLAIYAEWETEGEIEPFGVITVNLSSLPKNRAALDTNNLPGIDEVLFARGLCKLVDYAMSGFCIYPIVEFDMAKLHEYLV